MTTSWKVVTVGEALESLDSRRRPVKSADRKPGPYPYWGASGVVDYVDGFLFDEPALLVSEDGENLRTRKTPIAFYVTGKYWVNNHAHVFRARDGQDLRFHAYQFQTLDVAGYLTGSTQPKLTAAAVQSIRLAAPPLSEQRRIAEVLGALDDLIDTNEQLVARAASLAREVFRIRFPNFAESHAAEVGFTEYVDVVSGGTPKTSEDSYWGGEIPWFSIVDAPADDQPWVLKTVKTITQQGLDGSPTNLIPVGSTILSARGTVGKVALVGVPMAMNQSCYALKPRGDGAGFFEFFATESVVNRLKAAAHGSVFDTITRQTLEAMLVEVVPLEDRAAFDERVKALMATCRELALENAQLRRTRDELLPLLMSGAVRVRPEGVAA